MKKILFYVGYWIILFYACWIGGGGNSCHFDQFSNNLMISDLICERNFGGKEFIQSYGDLDDGVYVQEFKNDYQPASSNVWVYTSQVGSQRYLYRAFDTLLPFSGGFKLFMMSLLNAGLLALVLTIIVKYIVSSIGILPGLITAGVLLCAGTLLRFGTNLYWIGWMLFLPMVISILYANNISEKSIKKILLVSFIGNLLKNLCYFEFASAIMVATVLPFLFAAIKEKIELRRTVRVFFAASAGAICGFAGSLIWKFILLIKYNHSIDLAIQQFMFPIKMRVTGTGNVDSFSDTVLTSKSASTLEVIKYYLNTHDIRIGSFTFSNKILIYAIIICVMLTFLIFLLKRSKDRTGLALAICTTLSFAGPLSWMILAKPHAYIHRSQCAILWWIPLFFYGVPLCIHTLMTIYHEILVAKREKSN